LLVELTHRWCRSVYHSVHDYLEDGSGQHVSPARGKLPCEL
jgi:hypothetical protein